MEVMPATPYYITQTDELTKSLLDIHTGNVLIADPDLELLRPEELAEKLGDSETGKVTRVDGAPLEAGIPDYLVVPLKLDQKTIEGLDHAYLADFGECNLQSSHHFQDSSELTQYSLYSVLDFEPS